jgi:hypothetical protein
MCAVERTGEISALPEVTRAPGGSITAGCVFRVGALEGFGQGIGAFRNGDEMHVIRHQGVAENADLVGLAVACERCKIPLPVAVRMENGLPVIATLRYVVRYAGKDGSRAAGHGEQIVPGPEQNLKKNRGLTPF